MKNVEREGFLGSFTGLCILELNATEMEYLKRIIQ